MEEIGGETVGLWKLWLEDKLNAIMPYYNKLYETTVKDYDYMVDVDTTEDLQRTESRKEDTVFNSNQQMDSDTTDNTTISQTVNTTGNTDTHSDSKTTGNPTSHSSHNDFPQAPLEQNKGYGTYEDYIQNVLSENVLVDNTETVDNLQTTNGADNRKVTTNQETTANSTNNLTEDKGMEHTIHKRGLNGARSFTDLLMQYRQSLINIDMLIIKELSDLFMRVY